MRSAALALLISLAALTLLAAPAGAQLVDAQMKPGDQFTGDIEDAADIDLVEVETVAGTIFKIIVGPVKGSSLVPTVQLIDTSDDSVVATVSAKKKKAVLKTPAVATTGTYLIRITGTDGSTGGYLLKFTEKLAKTAKKVLLDAEVANGAPLVLTFDAAEGFELTATLSKKGGKSGADPAEPALQDPNDIEQLIPDEKLKVNKKGNKYTLKKVALGATGTWTLSTENEGEDGTMRGKVSLRRSKPQKRKLEELPIGDTGEPTLTGRVLASTSSDPTGLPGVTVTVAVEEDALLGNEPVTVISDEDGLFVVPSPPEGTVLVTFDGSTQTSGSNVFPLFTQRVVVDRDGPTEMPGPTVLTRQSQVDTGFASNVPGAGGVTTGPLDAVSGPLEMEFHGPTGTTVFEDGGSASFPISPRINRVHPEDLAVPLLDGLGDPLDVTFVADIEPASLQFDTSTGTEGSLPQGLDLVLPNDRGFAPGTLLDIWSYDPLLSEWVNRSTQTGQQGLVDVTGARVEASDVVLQGGLYAAVLAVDPACATTLEGRVQDLTTNAPLIGCDVTTSLGLTGTTDVNGEFSIPLVPAYDPGDLPVCIPVGFEVIVTTPVSFGGERVEASVAFGSVVPGGVTDVGILSAELPGTGTVVGEVIDNGFPVVSGLVSLDGPTPTVATTDDNGLFFLAGLAPGSYTGGFTFVGDDDPTDVAFSLGAHAVTSIAIQRAGGQGDHDVTVRVVRVPSSPFESPQALSGVTVVLVGDDPFSSQGLTATTNAQGRAEFTDVDPPYDVTASDDQLITGDLTVRVTTSVLGADPGDDALGIPLADQEPLGEADTDATLSGTVSNLPEGSFTTYLVEAVSADPGFPFSTSTELFFDGEYELDVVSGRDYHLIVREEVTQFAFPDDLVFTNGVFFALNVADPGFEGDTVTDFDFTGPGFLAFDQVIDVDISGLPAASQIGELTLAYALHDDDPAVDGLALLTDFDEVFGDDQYLPPSEIRLPDPADPLLAGFRQTLTLSHNNVDIVERGGACELPFTAGITDVTFDLAGNPVITNPSDGEVFELADLDGLTLGWLDPSSGPDRGWAAITLSSSDVLDSLGVDRAVWELITPLGAGQANLPPTAVDALGVGAWLATLDVRVLAGSTFDFDEGFGDAVDVNLPAALVGADAACLGTTTQEFEIVED
jgi:hypothetical protein